MILIASVVSTGHNKIFWQMNKRIINYSCTFTFHIICKGKGKRICKKHTEKRPLNRRKSNFQYSLLLLTLSIFLLLGISAQFLWFQIKEENHCGVIFREEMGRESSLSIYVSVSVRFVSLKYYIVKPITWLPDCILDTKHRCSSYPVPHVIHSWYSEF